MNHSEERFLLYIICSFEIKNFTTFGLNRKNYNVILVFANFK